eukprot:TRINITY_DN59887_c0_g1_i1.p1 TRINITY_DN59887_c0_g1~~TRINITY_DN59887_c0_g1_i1.p1  ORF type:complete len:295 (+),score=57.04 TRINITY_DN59887_c0_g1_i1:81-887(+)
MAEQFEGRVKAWYEQKGFGFITDANGNDVYVHHSAFGGGSLFEGQPVTFTVQAGKGGEGHRNGALRAATVTGPAVMGRVPTGDGSLKGVVKAWYDTKGFGFITGSDGNDYYVHHSAFGGGMLQQGLPVVFTLQSQTDTGAHRNGAGRVATCHGPAVRQGVRGGPPPPGPSAVMGGPLPAICDQGSYGAPEWQPHFSEAPYSGQPYPQQRHGGKGKGGKRDAGGYGAPVEPQGPPPAVGEWEVHESEEYRGRYYWFNPRTGESTWSCPM